MPLKPLASGRLFHGCRDVSPYSRGSDALRLALEQVPAFQISDRLRNIVNTKTANIGKVYDTLSDPGGRVPALCQPGVLGTRNLRGYGTQQFMGGKTNIIAGWSEKVLEFIRWAEAGIDTLTNRVENYRYK